MPDTKLSAPGPPAAGVEVPAEAVPDTATGVRPPPRGPRAHGAGVIDLRGDARQPVAVLDGPAGAVRSPAGTTNRLGLVVDLACWAAVAGVAAVGAAALAHVDGPLPVVWAVAATPVVMLPAYPVLVAALARRRRLLAAVAAALVVLHLVLLAPAVGVTGGLGPGGAGPAVRVATANVFVENGRVAETGRRLLAADADVVLLQEVTPAHADGLRALFAAYPHRFLDARDGPFGFAILSRFPMRGAERALVGGHPLARARVQVGEVEVQVWNVHPPAPRDAGARRTQEAQLHEVARRARTSEGALLVAGDFNATRWSRELGRLRSAGLADAHEAVRRGLAATWPAGRAVPPFLLLDRVLFSSELGATSVGELAAGASDHRPVVVDLRLRAARA